MHLNLKKHKDDLLFLPLGGSGEIGMNMNLYHLDGKWLIADFGAGFAEDYMPGIDMIVPDISFLREHRKDIVGIVLTHAHEDHLGAIPYLWNEVKVPIYATPFTSSFLKAKLSDNRGLKKADIRVVEQGSSFKLGPFDIELAQITHSVPEMNAIFIRTRFGNIFHSGDWKLDPKPMLGDDTDEKKLKKYGKEGVLAMVSDSTNVFSPGVSGSEGDLRNSLTKIIKKCENLVMVTTFASNVARIESIAVAAQKNNRKVILAGRSLWRIVAAAKDAGYLQDAPEFLEDTAINNYKRSELLVISTGCQGEPRAATSKIATDNHRNIKLRPDDNVIFSSKIIPGNDKRIFRLFNRLAQAGINVLTEKDHFVHVSGHPNVDEMKRMYKMIKPQISIPVHGEHTHIQEHARLATEEWGANEAFKVKNGDVLKLSPEGVTRVAEVKVGEFGIDGYFLLAPDSEILRTRRKIQNDGVVVVSLIMDKDNRLVLAPIVTAPGALDDKEDQDIIEDIVDEIKLVLNDSAKGSKKAQSNDRIINIVRSAVKRIVKKETGKNPPIRVNVVNK